MPKILGGGGGLFVQPNPISSSCTFKVLLLLATNSLFSYFREKFWFELQIYFVQIHEALPVQPIRRLLKVLLKSVQPFVRQSTLHPLLHITLEPLCSSLPIYRLLFAYYILYKLLDFINNMQVFVYKNLDIDLYSITFKHQGLLLLICF